MRIRRSIVLVFALALVGLGAFWVRSSVADTPRKLMLPQTVGAEAVCGPETGPEHYEYHLATFQTLGTFQEKSLGEPTRIMAEVGRQYISGKGLKTVPLQIVSIGGRGIAEGIGETRFWLDATRPVKSAIWEKQPGTEFPAVQEMRFHFFYTLEAMPGRVFRSIEPARMRSNDVRAFPPPPGTVYRLMEPVELEDVAEPGVVVGKILANRVVIPKAKERMDREPT